MKGGDVLVGKVAPKVRRITAENDYLKQFWRKAKDVQDTLTVPYGKSGTVIDVKTLTEKEPN